MTNQPQILTFIFCIWSLTLTPYMNALANEFSISLLALDLSKEVKKEPCTETMPFLTIARGRPLGDHPVQPLYTVVTTPNEWNALRGKFPEQAFEAGARTSRLNDDPIIIVFAGIKHSSGYSISISGVFLENDHLFIDVYQTIPNTNDIVEPATTLPYHIVTIPKKRLYPSRVFTFVFRDREGIVLDKGIIKF